MRGLPASILAAFLLFPACGGGSSPSGTGGSGGSHAGATASFDLSADLGAQDHFYDVPYPSDLRLTAQGKSRSEAEELVATVDNERAAFVKKYHAKSWPLRELYHLMINSQVGDEVVLQMILAEMELLNGKVASRSR